MTSIAKPKIAHPSLPKNELGLTRRDYEGGMSTLCAGCGHDSTTAAIVEAAWGLSLRPQEHRRRLLTLSAAHTALIRCTGVCHRLRPALMLPIAN